MKLKIPYGKPSIKDLELPYACDVAAIDRNYLSCPSINRRWRSSIYIKTASVISLIQDCGFGVLKSYQPMLKHA